MAVGVFAHCVVSRLIGPWWSPDITLILLVLLSSLRPAWWVPLAATAGLLTMCWMGPAPWLPLTGYAVLGISLTVLAMTWDLHDERIQLVIVGSAEAAWLLFQLWVQSIPVWPLLPLAVLHVLVTIAAVGLTRQLLRRWVVADPETAT